MALLKLQTDSDEAFYLWGILTECAGHRLCWELNRAGGYALIRADDLKASRDSAPDAAYYSFYRYDDEEEGYRIEIIGNHSGGEYFMTELRNFDFLLLVKGDLDGFDKKTFGALLKRMDCIRSALAIDDRKLKFRQQLILE